jgi:hypothetical protein
MNLGLQRRINVNQWLIRGDFYFNVNSPFIKLVIEQVFF